MILQFNATAGRRRGPGIVGLMFWVQTPAGAKRGSAGAARWPPAPLARGRVPVGAKRGSAGAARWTPAPLAAWGRPTPVLDSAAAQSGP
jgi:hypothetical protein